MEDLLEIIKENIFLIAIVGFSIFSAIFNKTMKKSKPKTRTGQRMEPRPAKGKQGPGLEDKIRKFFDDLTVDEQKGKTSVQASSSQPTDTAMKSAYQEQVQPVLEDDSTMQSLTGTEKIEVVSDPTQTPESPWYNEEALIEEAEPAPWKDESDLPVYSREEQRKKHTQLVVDDLPSAEYETIQDKDSDAIGNLMVGSLTKLSKQDLRKAIVLKEVLGKPISLQW